MPESVQQYESAAAERLYDALAIALTKGRHLSLGSVYLFGYVIEMVLKSAFFRVVGWDLTKPVDLRRIAEARGSERFGGRRTHDLDVLLDAFMADRARRGKGLPDTLESELRRRIARAADWSVDLRYDGRSTTENVVAGTYEDANWFFAHRFVLAQ